RHVLIVEPFGNREPRVSSLVRALRGAELIDDCGETRAFLEPISGRDSTAVVEPYVRVSRHWGTATPVILPGRDDRDPRKAASLIAKAMRQAGHDVPAVHVQVRRAPVLDNSYNAVDYHVASHLKRWPRVHGVFELA